MRWKISLLLMCAMIGLSTPVYAQGERGSTRAAQMNTVGAIQIDERDDGTYIGLEGSEVPTFSVFKLNDPLRLFVDISNSKLKGETLSREVGNGVISKVALIEYEDSFQTVTRLIIGFDKGAHYDVRAEGNKVVIFVDGAQRTRENKNLANVEQELAQKQAQLAQAQSQIKNNEARYEQAFNELSSTRSRLEAAQAEMKELQQRLSESTGAERRKVESAIVVQDKALEVAQREVAQREKTVATLRTQLDTLGRERDQATERAERLEIQRKAAEAAAKKAAVERENALALARTHEQEGKNAQKRAEELQANLTQVRTELDHAASEKESYRARVNAMSEDAKQALARVEAQERQLNDAKRREAELERELAALRSTKQAADERSKNQQKAEERLAEERLASAQKSRSQEESRLAQIQAERLEVEGELSRARAALAQTQQQLADSQAQRASLPAGRAVAVDANSENNVRGIRLETTEQGRSRIVVELDHPGQFETLPWKDSRAVMILNGVKLPKHLEKTLSSVAQGGAVRFVSSYANKAGQVRVEAELRGGASEMVSQQGNDLIWEFAPMHADASSASHAQEKAPQPARGGESFTSAPPNQPLVVPDPTRVNSVPGMSKKRLTIDLRNADIQNVLRLIAKEGGVNIIAGDGVAGSVTMRLRSVPLDQVFLTILQSLQLGFEVRGNVIRVAPQTALNAEETARAEARARAQRVQPLEVFLLPVNYASANDLVGQVSGLLSPRGSVTVDKRTNTLVIKDLRENLDAMRTLIESLDSQVPQVLIEARIVETNDTFARQIGIQWGGDVSFSQGNGNPTGLIFPNVLGIGGGATDGQTPTSGTSSNPNFAVNLPAPAGTGAGGAIGLTMGSVGGGVNLNLRLSAMEEAGHAKIVSSPRILTLDNRQATISQGTSIPISVVSAAGVQTVFVDATLDLTVTPHVTPDGNVQLTIQATKNEPDFQNTGARGDPTIIRRQANTELLIRDGDTTVIGGIYTRNAGSSVSAVPFFHRIPILGFFFRTTSQSERRSELLIFITPRIVNRVESLGVTSAGSLSGELGED